MDPLAIAEEPGAPLAAVTDDADRPANEEAVQKGGPALTPDGGKLRHEAPNASTTRCTRNVAPQLIEAWLRLTSIV